MSPTFLFLVTTCGSRRCAPPQLAGDPGVRSNHKEITSTCWSSTTRSVPRRTRRAAVRTLPERGLKR
jgi:hypothetical protein